ncbi:MAG: DUF4339 domain-containing protein [Chitinophagales bacterium]
MLLPTWERAVGTVYSRPTYGQEKLNSETLVWTEGMDNWKAKEVSELFQLIKPKATPPPPPSDIDEKISRTEVSGEIKVVKEKLSNPTIEAITPSNSNLVWIVIWCGFHFFALLTSYSEINFLMTQETRY